MKIDFDGEKYKQASAQQEAWGKGLIGELELAGHERMLAETKQNDGTYFETFRRMNVWARK